MRKVKKTLHEMRYVTLFIYFVILIIIGYALNTISPHRYFYLNQYILFAMFFIQKLVTQKMDEENRLIEKELLDAKENEVRGSFKLKTNFLINTSKGKIISMIFVIIYIFTMFRLGCLEPTITGLYGGILGAIVFYSGIQAYFRYLSLLYFSHDLKKIHLENYFFYNPALTEWISRLAQEFSYIEKWFLILGLMYSGIYALNIPDGAIKVNKVLSFHTNSNFWFFLTWIGIIVFFALAVPTFTFLNRYYIKECIKQCKRKSIKKLEKQINILSIDSTERDLNILQAKISLINEISISEDYPLNYKYTVFDRGYAICLSLVTLISPFASIIEQVFFDG